MKLDTYIINVSFLFIVFFTLVSTSVLAIYGPISSQPSYTPATCQSLGKQCGTWSDGCGGTLNCGSCQSGYICNLNG
jgi:hypothetical protein